MIYAYSYSYTIGIERWAIAFLPTQPDATFIPYDVPDNTWLYLDSLNAIQIYTALQMAQKVMSAQIALLYTGYQADIQKSVSYMSAAGVVELYQSNFASIDNLQRVLQGYGGTKIVPVGFYWVAADNVQVPFTYADLQGLATVMMAQGWIAFQKLQTLKAKILACTTVAQVQAVVW